MSGATIALLLLAFASGRGGAAEESDSSPLEVVVPSNWMAAKWASMSRAIALARLISGGHEVEPVGFLLFFSLPNFSL